MSPNQITITEQFDGHPIDFQTGDAFVNLTALCATFKKRPQAFLNLDSTKAFRDELEKSNDSQPIIETIHGGAKPGTWAHPDLALECARWLSPKLAIWCNQTIRKILAGEAVLAAPTPALPKTFPEALRMLADSEEEKSRMALTIEEQKPAVAVVQRIVDSKGNKNFREVAKILGLKEKEFIAKLVVDEVLFRIGIGGSLVPYATPKSEEYFDVTIGEAHGHCYKQTRVTPEGIVWLAKTYAIAA